MSLVRTVAKAMFYGTGGLRLIRYRNRGGLRILMYHRFSDLRGLERQCEHLRTYYRPISLDDAAKALQPGGKLPDNAVVVTVDDGYRDFLAAYRIFRRYRIPATLFVTTDFLDTGDWLWVDRVRYAFRHARVREATIELSSGDVRFSGEQPDQSTVRLTEALKAVSNEERLSVIDALPRVLQTDIPAKPPEEYAPLDWEQVRALAAEGADFGAHTRSHPILSRLPGGQLRDEIEGSRRRIEQETGRRISHFCYPNGKPEDVAGAPVEAVRRAGFQTAVTTVAGLNYPAGDLLLLKRIGVTPEYPDRYFQQCAAGFRV